MQVLEVINALRSAVEEGKIDMRDEVLVEVKGQYTGLHTVNMPVKQISKSELRFDNSEFLKANLQIAQFVD